MTLTDAGRRTRAGLRAGWAAARQHGPIAVAFYAVVFLPLAVFTLAYTLLTRGQEQT